MKNIYNLLLFLWIAANFLSLDATAKSETYTTKSQWYDSKSFIVFDTLPDGRSIWELEDEEIELFADAQTRKQVTGCYCDIKLNVQERLYMFGKLFSYALPTAKMARGAAVVDDIAATGDDVVRVSDDLVKVSDETVSIFDDLLSNAAKSDDLLRQLDDVTIIVAKNGDDLEYLNAVGADAVYITGINKSGTILIRENAPKSALIEEALHHVQRLHYGEKHFTSNRVSLEIQAQDILIHMAYAEKWQIEELHRLQAAKKSWLKLQEQN